MVDIDNGWTIDSVLGSIRLYANENSLSATQVKDIFEAGMFARNALFRRPDATESQSKETR